MLTIDIVTAISALSRTAQLQFDPQSFKIISVVEDTGTQICCSIAASSLFEDYVTVSGEENKIVIELSVDELIKAFKGSGGADEVAIKLTRRKGTKMASLRIFISQTRSTSFYPEVVQDLPIHILRFEYGAIREYTWSDPDVYIRLPTPITSLLKIADRFKSLSKRLTVLANNQGSLELVAEAEGVCVRSNWKNMQVVLTEDSGGLPSQGMDTFYSCTIKTREWHSILQVSSIAQKIILGVINEHALVLYCYIDALDDDQVLTYYVKHLDN